MGKWLNLHRHRQRAASHPTRLGQQLTALDPWWNPPWPISWQRSYWAARHHLYGLPAGMVWWLGAPNEVQVRQWLHTQQASWRALPPGQQELVADLDLCDSHPDRVERPKAGKEAQLEIFLPPNAAGGSV
ncbi:hypothetical protein ACWDR2_34870 [Streptomyces sp. NPDC003631]